MHTEELGTYIGNTFQLKNEEATLKYCGMFLDILLNIEKKIENFAMEELYPILVN